MPDAFAALSQMSRSLTSGIVLFMGIGLHVPRGDKLIAPGSLRVLHILISIAIHKTTPRRESRVPTLRGFKLRAIAWTSGPGTSQIDSLSAPNDLMTKNCKSS